VKRFDVIFSVHLGSIEEARAFERRAMEESDLSAPEPAKRLAKPNPKYFDESDEPALKKSKTMGKKVNEKTKTVRKQNKYNPVVSK
jgi:hypothetical protein